MSTEENIKRLVDHLKIWAVPRTSHYHPILLQEYYCFIDGSMDNPDTCRKFKAKYDRYIGSKAEKTMINKLAIHAFRRLLVESYEIPAGKITATIFENLNKKQIKKLNADLVETMRLAYSD